MRLSRSMENLAMLPEEAKLAASLLRLTLSDKIESQSSKPDSEFQSYMRTNNQFPYHRSILIVDKRPEPATVDKSTETETSPINPPSEMKSTRPQQKRRFLRRRCESSPSSISNDEKEPATPLSQSAPTESFFHRLFPSFLRRRFSKEGQEQQDAKQVAPIVVTAAAQAKVEPFPTSEELSKDNAGHFVRQFVRMENNMDNLIFMSMR